MKNAGCGDGNRRTRGWATPHAEIAIVAGGVLWFAKLLFFSPLEGHHFLCFFPSREWEGSKGHGFRHFVNFRSSTWLPTNMGT